MLKENEKWEICSECAGEGLCELGDIFITLCPDCGGKGKIKINLDSLEVDTDRLGGDED